MMKSLRDRMRVDLQLSGAKPITQRIYLREADNLVNYFNRSPEELGEAELKEYLLHLIQERHLSEGTFRFYVAALKFLIPNDVKTRMAGGEDKASPGQEETASRSGSLGGESPLGGDDESQTQSDSDDHLLLGIEGQ